MIAALPMYDWPEVRAATDRLWTACRDGFRAAGIPAPEELDRQRGLAETWRDPGLVLGQTCGLPYIRGLRDRVALIGALDYALPACPPGWYRSAIVVHRSDPRRDLAEFRGAAVAVNGRDSQSGWASLMHHVAPLAKAGSFFGSVQISGAHSASADLVADGGADLAAIDLVSWRLYQRFRPPAAALRELALTDPTPGLPLIAAPGVSVPRYRAVLAAAIGNLDAATRAELGLRDFVALEPDDYRIIDARLRAAEAVVSI